MKANFKYLYFFFFQENTSLNTLSSAELESIWIPFVLFENTELNQATKVDEDTEMTITRKKY